MSLTDSLLNLLNSHNLEDVSALYAQDFSGVDVTDRSRVTGPEGVVKQLERLWDAFPDLCFESAPPIFQKNRVALYWIARGTHRGTVLNIPPTGREVAVNGITLLHIENDKIKHALYLWDMAALLRDLGLLPELDYRTPVVPMTFQETLALFGTDA